MEHLVHFLRKPTAQTIYMIAGWQQWADAGAISSGLPAWLIEETNAEKIAEIRSDDFYLFQLPGTHHLLRREVHLEDGIVQSLSEHKNEFYYVGDERNGLVIFLGEEPHIEEDRYADAFFHVIEELGVQRTAVLGGVYGSMPYDKDRDVSCSFSLESMRSELEEYAVRFSNYRGGTTIGTFLVEQARRRSREFVAFYAFVPAYEFAQLAGPAQGIRIEVDYKAWYDLMRRLNHMFDLGVSLSELNRQSEELITSIEADVEELAREVPQLNIHEYMRTINEEFTEHTFMPLDDVWERELGNLFDNLEDND